MTKDTLMTTDHSTLAEWSDRAAAILDQIVAEAHRAAGPLADDPCMDIRILLAEHRALRAGLPPWTAQIRRGGVTDPELDL